MTTNITPAFVRDETLNSNLVDLDDPTLAKYIKRAINVIGSYLPIKQFVQADGSYIFPDDLSGAIVYFIEWIFIDNNGMFGGGSSDIASEKIGNYGYTKDKRAAGSSDQISMPINIRAILDTYATWATDFGIHIGNRDRTYTDADATDVPFNYTPW